MSNRDARTATCPADAGFNPLSPEYLADPYPQLAAAREAAPVFYAPTIDMWVITRHADIAAVFDDPETFSASIAQAPLFPLSPDAAAILSSGFGGQPVMSNLDPPEHSRIRKRLAKVFSPKRSHEMGPLIHERAVELIDAFVTNGRVDIVRDLCYPLPALTIFSLIGFPNDDADRLKSWCGDKLEVNWGHPTGDAQRKASETMVTFWRYCEDFVARRNVEPADDLTGSLIADRADDPNALTDREIASILFGLSFAGHETTTNLIANALHQLLQDAQRWAAITADAELIPGAVEETLRHDTSVIAWRRIATRDTEIGGMAIPSGARLMLALGSANHDPAVFDQPDRFDMTRENARVQISFGKGIHFCLGATLARLEAAIVLRVLAERLPDLRLAPSDPPDYSPNIAFRGPLELWVEWDPSATAGSHS